MPELATVDAHLDLARSAPVITEIVRHAAQRGTAWAADTLATALGYRAATQADPPPAGQPHIHTPGPPLHDDHVCPHVRCSTCGTPGLNVDGHWQDTDPATQT